MATAVLENSAFGIQDGMRDLKKRCSRCSSTVEQVIVRTCIIHFERVPEGHSIIAKASIYLVMGDVEGFERAFYE